MMDRPTPEAAILSMARMLFMALLAFNVLLMLAAVVVLWLWFPAGWDWTPLDVWR